MEHPNKEIQIFNRQKSIKIKLLRHVMMILYENVNEYTSPVEVYWMLTCRKRKYTMTPLRFPSFPVVDWFCLFIDSWVFTFSLEDCSVFGNFVITLITQHTQRVQHIIMCTQKIKLFEFLKYNNICSLTAILNELISKLCGLSTKYAQILRNGENYAL